MSRRVHSNVGRSASVGSAGASPSLAIDIVEEAGDWRNIPDVASAIRSAADVLAVNPQLNLGSAEACIALSEDAHVRDLNRSYRAKDKPTNVLSFPAAARVGGDRRIAEGFLGDIVLAYETVMREAAELSIPTRHHLQHLVVHGLLHLLGYDHETDAEAEAMEAIEIETLAGLGIPNPYLAAEAAQSD